MLAYVGNDKIITWSQKNVPFSLPQTFVVPNNAKTVITCNISIPNTIAYSSRLACLKISSRWNILMLLQGFLCKFSASDF
jgi:hypothetical protein